MFSKKSDQDTARSLIAIVSSEQAHEEIRFITAKLPEVTSSIKKTDDTLRDGSELVNGSADVVIIEADLSDPNSEPVLKDLCQYVSQNGSLIVLASNATPASTRAMFKAGVNDVISLPLDRKDLLMSLESAFGALAARKGGLQSRGKVITFTKCGGGSGATTLATNVASALINGGKSKKERAKDKNFVAPSVAIFDFDVQFGTVAVGLNSSGRASILDARRAEDRLDASLLEASMQKHSSGLNILASPEEIVPFTAFSSEFFEQIIGIARAMFDYVIIDMPQAWTSWTHSVFDESDVIVPVMKANVENVHNAQKVLIGLDHLKVSRDKSIIVVNSVSKGMTDNDRITQIKKITDRPIVQVREDQKANKIARDRGALLSEVASNSSTTKDIAKCAEKIIQHLNKMVTTAAPTASHSGASLTDQSMGQ